jgi:hypothetical protein
MFDIVLQMNFIIQLTFDRIVILSKIRKLLIQSGK